LTFKIYRSRLTIGAGVGMGAEFAALILDIFRKLILSGFKVSII
jgi:hypothetical protein